MPTVELLAHFAQELSDYAQLNLSILLSQKQVLCKTDRCLSDADSVYSNLCLLSDSKILTNGIFWEVYE